MVGWNLPGKSYPSGSFHERFIGLKDKIINPIIPDNVDADSIEILEILTKYSPWNANSVINIDIVKPIPAKKPIPIICVKFTMEDNLANLSFMAIYVNRVIPTDFPIIKPKEIPIAKGLLNNVIICMSLNSIPVFANANNGIIKNKEKFRNLFSRVCNGDDTLLE